MFRLVLPKVEQVSARSVDLHIATLDGAVITKTAEVGTGCANVWGDPVYSYLLQEDNQYLDKETGRWVQVVGERCAFPKCTRRPIKEWVGKANEIILGIYIECLERAKLDQFKKQNKTSGAELLVKITSILAVIMMIIYAISHRGGGGF
jgi:hypothetical protein